MSVRPCTAGSVLVSWGILLSPAVGAIRMSVSTMIVALDGQRLHRTAL
jgi:Cu2+-exporting ATPase